MSIEYPLVVPPLAARAYAEATRIGFGADGGVSSSQPAVGPVLAALAAGKPGGRIAELGTGVGAGAAWLLSGMDSAARLVTAESDPERAAIARLLFGGDDRVTVVEGEWEDHLPQQGPYDLVFVDSGFSARLHEREAAAFLLEMVVDGGQLVLDDLTPEASLGEDREGPDPKRELALRHPQVIGAELYPPAGDGSLGGYRSGLLLMTKVARRASGR